MTNTVVFGGASGIGQALAHAYRAAGDPCIVVDRASRAPKWPEDDYYEYDLTNDKHANKLWGQLEQRYDRRSINRVVFSTGLQERSASKPTASDLWHINYECVTKAYFNLNMALFLLAVDAQIVVVSSDMIFQDDVDITTPLYRDTKASLTTYFMREAEEDPNKRFVFAFPGPVNTPLFRAGKSEETLARIACDPGIMEPGDCAAQLIRLAEGDPAQALFLRLYAHKTTSIPMEEVQGCLARFTHLTR